MTSWALSCGGLRSPGSHTSCQLAQGGCRYHCHVLRQAMQYSSTQIQTHITRQAWRALKMSGVQGILFHGHPWSITYRSAQSGRAHTREQWKGRLHFLPVCAAQGHVQPLGLLVHLHSMAQQGCDRVPAIAPAADDSNPACCVMSAIMH